MFTCPNFGKDLITLKYYSGVDCIVDDARWKPGGWDGMKGLHNRGPEPSPSFLRPEDPASFKTGSSTAV
jgi:hypothetical protein